MDVPRSKSGSRKRQIRRIVYGILTLVAVAGITVGVSSLKPAARSIEGGTLYTDVVKRGSILRQVRGLGTLVPEEIRWIPTLSQGRVERIIVRAGAEVSANTVLIELSNPELEQAALEAEQQLKGAQAALRSLQARLNNDLLNQKAQAATVGADYKNAKLQAEVNEDLKKQGLVSDLQFKVSQVRAEELATRYELEQERLSQNAESVQAQLAQQQADVDRYRALVQLRRQQVEGLHVRAGSPGVVQLVSVQEGQQVAPGTNLARVADPSRLKAELRIAETQAKDIEIGQKSMVDTRNGVIPGRVIRIDPAATNGTVTVDVALEGELPKGARPDLSVDGTVELETLENILYVNRPVHGQENTRIGIFKMDPDGKEAARVQVQLGRSSVNTIEIIDGLKEGDKVILSDTSAYDDTDRVRID